MTAASRFTEYFFNVPHLLLLIFLIISLLSFIYAVDNIISTFFFSSTFQVFFFFHLFFSAVVLFSSLPFEFLFRRIFSLDLLQFSQFVAEPRQGLLWLRHYFVSLLCYFQCAFPCVALAAGSQSSDTSLIAATEFVCSRQPF